MQAQFNACGCCPFMLRLTQGTHPNVRLTTCAVRAVGTHMHVLVYICVQGTHRCTLRHAPLKHTAMHKVHEPSCTHIGTTLHMKILSHTPPSTPQETLDICNGHTLAIPELGRQRQEN